MSRDPFKHEVRAYVKSFGKVKLCRVDATDEAAEVIYDNPGRTFEGPGEVLYIGRGEDMYASPHFKGRIAIRVQRSDFIAGRY